MADEKTYQWGWELKARMDEGTNPNLPNVQGLYPDSHEQYMQDPVPYFGAGGPGQTAQQLRGIPDSLIMRMNNPEAMARARMLRDGGLTDEQRKASMAPDTDASKQRQEALAMATGAAPAKPAEGTPEAELVKQDQQNRAMANREEYEKANQESLKREQQQQQARQASAPAPAPQPARQQAPAPRQQAPKAKTDE
jgi:hypothetical protein